MNAKWLAVAIAALFLIPTGADAQMSLSGLADLVARNSSEEDVTNLTFQGQSNLNTARVRLFADATVGENVSFFGQVLVDNYDIGLFGAYARFEELGGQWLNLQAGLIPNTVGNFPPRTYSDRNPLVGVPLVHNHHSALNPSIPQDTVDDLLVSRDVRSNQGLPILYDNCWNTGIETYGQFGSFDWSLAALSGSTSKPARGQVKEIPQATGRVSWYSGPGLVLGVNGIYGPYLFDGLEGITYPDGKGYEDYVAMGAGYDLYYSLRFIEFHSETMFLRWQHPTLGDLDVTSGYLEAKYKFRLGWYAAARMGFFEPGNVQDSAGDTQQWDYPVRRAEYGIGYRPMPRVTLKVVAQHNRFQGNSSLDRDHYIMQLSTGF